MTPDPIEPPAPERPAGARREAPPSGKPGYVPGQKKARHVRFARIVKFLTIGGLVAFAGVATWGVIAIFTRPSPEEVEVENCRTLLRGIATDVVDYRAKRNRLPATLAKLSQS